MRFIFWLFLGLVLGPTVMRFNQPVHLADLSFLAGGLFMFLAGWELKFLVVGRDARFILIAIIGSFIFPLLTGYLLLNRNLFLAVAISISALPVAIQILKEKDIYDSEFGRRAITIASFCDIGAWLIMGFIFPSQNVSSWITGHWVVAAFFAGLIFGRFVPWHRFAQWAQTWCFAPLLFVGLGWKIDLIRSFSIETCARIFIVAVVAKAGGTYLAMRAQRVPHRESVEYGAILNARGAMEIMAAGLAFSAGLIDASVLSALVVLGVLTSVMAVPLIAKRGAAR